MSASDIREAIAYISRVFSDQPEKAHTTGSATATLESGLRFSLSDADALVSFTDMPAAVGGTASAPKPGWLLRASLASCNATVIAMRAAQLGIELTILEVTVSSDGDSRGLLGTDESIGAALTGWQTRVRIAAQDTDPAQLREIVAWAEVHSPVGCSLRDASVMTTSIEIMSGG